MSIFTLFHCSCLKFCKIYFHSRYINAWLAALNEHVGFACLHAETGPYGFTANLYFNFGCFSKQAKMFAFHLHDDKAPCCTQKSNTVDPRYNNSVLLYKFTSFNSLTTEKQTTKFSSANFQKMLSPSYIILRIQRLEGKQCKSRWGGSLWATSSRSTLFANSAIFVTGS